MRRERELEDLMECWALNEAHLGLIADKSGATRLGSALALKFSGQEARVPRHAGDLPPAAVKFVAGQNSTELTGAASRVSENSPVLSSWMLHGSRGVITIWPPKNHWVLYGPSGIGPGRG
jgi:hypothetical protein